MVRVVSLSGIQSDSDSATVYDASASEWFEKAEKPPRKSKKKKVKRRATSSVVVGQKVNVL